MEFRDRSGRLDTALNERLWSTVSDIQNSLQVDDRCMADIIHISTRNFEKKRDKFQSLSLREASNLADYFDVSIEALFDDSLDLKCLAQRFFAHQADCFPEKYQIDAKSRRRTTLGILNFIESKFGYSQRAKILKKFQLNEAVFLKPDEKIHLNLNLLIAQSIFEASQNTALLYEMGTYSILQHQNSVFINNLLDSSHPIEPYERMFCEIAPKYLEENYRWEIHRTSGKFIVLRGYPNPQLIDEIRINPELHRLGCFIRSGFIGGTANLLNQTHYRAIKTQCVTQGDISCSYHIQMNT